MIVLKNSRYLSPKGIFEDGDIYINDEGIIISIDNLLGEQHSRASQNSKIPISNDSDKTQHPSGSQYLKKHGYLKHSHRNCVSYDLKGKRVVPGLIDIHSHGAIGFDFSLASPEEICEVGRFYLLKGVTSFMPTTVSMSRERIIRALENIRLASEMDCEGARILGVHIEGPFINIDRKGAHNPACIRPPSREDFDEYREIMGDLKIHITVAPEVENGLDFINYVTENGGSIGIGHTTGDYEMALKGIGAGASIFTHLFNAMGGIHHRDPGMVGAAITEDIYFEIIADGIHVHPAILKMAIRAKGPKGVVLITDSIHASGLNPGTYTFGGLKIFVQDGAARLEDGTLAGSTLNLMDALKNVMKFTDVSLEDAISMASINPLKAIGADGNLGSIKAGKRGDLLILDASASEPKIDMVMLGGRFI